MSDTKIILNREFRRGETVYVGNDKHKVKDRFTMEAGQLTYEDVDPSDEVPPLYLRWRHMEVGCPFLIGGVLYFKATKSTAFRVQTGEVIELKKKEFVKAAWVEISTRPIDADHFVASERDSVGGVQEEDEPGFPVYHVVKWSELLDKVENLVLIDYNSARTIPAFNREASRERHLANCWRLEVAKARVDDLPIRLVVTPDKREAENKGHMRYASEYGVPEYICLDCDEIVEDNGEFTISQVFKDPTEPFPFAHGEKDYDGLYVAYMTELRKEAAALTNVCPLPAVFHRLYKKARKEKTGVHLILTDESVVNGDTDDFDTAHGIPKSLLFEATRVSLVRDGKVVYVRKARSR